MLHQLSDIASNPDSVSLIYLFLFLIGLAIGSFLNVVIFRYEPEKGLLTNIFGRSHCDFCGRALRWFELLPLISFIIQSGRCRSCGARLSLQYPLVEFLSGLTLVLVPLTFSSKPLDLFGKFFYANFFFTPHPLMGGLPEELVMDLIWILVFLILIVISVIDLRLQLIPDILSVWLTVLGALALATRYYFHDFGLAGGVSYGSFLGSYALIFRFNGELIVNFLLGAVLGLLFFGGLYLITKGLGIGLGDVKLALPLGLLFGFPDIVVVSILSFIIGAVFGIWFILRGRKSLKDHLPFAPFMATGVTLVFFFGYHIIDAYFKIFRF